jgi:ArsR family transcriptional regulator, virulence genes transcriptional regulator
MITAKTTKTTLGFDLKQLKNLSTIVKAINHPLRMRIVKTISESESLTVTQIYFKLRIEQSVASQHLAILREAEVLIATRNGKNINYSVNEPMMAGLIKSVELLCE